MNSANGAGHNMRQPKDDSIPDSKPRKRRKAEPLDPDSALPWSASPPLAAANTVGFGCLDALPAAAGLAASAASAAANEAAGPSSCAPAPVAEAAAGSSGDKQAAAAGFVGMPARGTGLTDATRLPDMAPAAPKVPSAPGPPNSFEHHESRNRRRASSLEKCAGRSQRKAKHRGGSTSIQGGHHELDTGLTLNSSGVQVRRSKRLQHVG